MVKILEWLLFLVLVALGYGVLACGLWEIGLDQAAAASLAGALFGSAALLLGNWINRFNDQSNSKQKQNDEVEKLKALITVELVNVAHSLIYAKKIVDAAIGSAQNSSPAETMDMSRYIPSQMPFTDSLGTKLLALEKGTIAAIVTLRSNLAITRESMDEVTAGARLGPLKATSLSKQLSYDMNDLAKVFTHVAPTYKLRIGDAEPELVTEILRRKANSPTNNGYMGA